MRSLVGLILAAAIAIGSYYYFLQRAAPVEGGSAIQAISTTGVEMDLMAIAQAERIYLAQHGSYGRLDDLVSSGAMTLERRGRDGYTFSIETRPGGFVVTARHSNEFPAPTGGAPPPHYPTLTIDQSLQIRRID